MEYSEWAPQYARIRDEFGFPFDRERAAADRLRALLPADARSRPLERVAARLRGRDAVVVGLGPRAGPPPLWRMSATSPSPAVVAADGAAATCLDAGVVPSVVVTDLDGPVAAEVAANQCGCLVVVHAHGDNAAAVERWVPQFPGELAGSWAGPPDSELIDVGGFTDGDRAACLAAHVGAARVLLWGFDFAHVEEAEPADRARKLAKLEWARTILADLADSGGPPVLTLERSGATVPYVGGRRGASTR